MRLQSVGTAPTLSCFGFDEVPSAGLPAHAYFARYEILRCIGKGGMGTVYEARHAVLNKRVALKLLHGVSDCDGAAQERFLREAELAARVRHPHIVDVIDAGVEHSVPFLVMELLEGESLAALLSREERLCSREAVDLALPLASGLMELHRQGILHCDVKPENVVMAVDARGDLVVKLVDFGISKDLEVLCGDTARGSRTQLRSATHSERRTLEGTPHYMAPEQVRGEADLDARTDQYALAVLLYECLSGSRPFESDSLLDLAYRIYSGEHTPLHTLRPDLPTGLADVIARAMSLRMEDRFDSMEAFGQALLPFASSELRAAYERDFFPARRSSAPPARRSWLPARASVASRQRSSRAEAQRASLACGERVPMKPAVAFLRSALVTAALLVGALSGWYALGDSSQLAGRAVAQEASDAATLCAPDADCSP